MKGLLLVLILAVPVFGQDAGDRAAIERLIAELNDPKERPAVLAEADRDAAAELEHLWAGRQPWSETTAPHINIQRVRFLTADVALVDVAAVQYGTVTGRYRIPFLLVLLRANTKWRIAEVRPVMPSPTAWPARPPTRASCGCPAPLREWSAGGDHRRTEDIRARQTDPRSNGRTGGTPA